MQKFNEKSVLITGGTSGIGLATAIAFRDAGARVVVTGSSEESIQRAQAALGEEAHVLCADARNVHSADQIAKHVRDRVGPLDAAFLNAGISRFVPIAQVDEPTYDDVMDTNVKGTVFAIQCLLQYALFAPEASIVVNTSAMQHKGVAAGAVYSATKGALGALVRVLAVELAPIRVNAVSPGPIDTPLYDKFGMPEDAVSGLKASLAGQLPLRRMGRPDDVAQAVLFLASPAAAFITGSEIAVDGGWGA
jgi:NAD(P)-dependent dehydrogenase (short-subunit alcohol dehydrogenase family)